ncbi:maleylpyruvate isomerase family mycothiol-dependent enzyme [Nocardiopsis chromatogenes]|uniref:maleylpyruvate isomerase family mycothiol-dependent enzyme n=1 Tax=Nocardiopsis chromatogenes TaxID=280239 RepID=UPI000346EA08|nr:maleylpyruvate isomerase family mycothiol-dependent enzyme [Nocardiopsis chromatogenes]
MEMKEIEQATERLVRTAERLTPEEIAAPSLLPRWTRGHVLAHVSRSADAVSGVLEAAREGREASMYPSEEAREADIDAGAGRPGPEQAADLRTSSDRFAAAVAAMPQERWDFKVRHRSGRVFRAAELAGMRILELEYHHVDLDAGYTPGHWQEAFVDRELRSMVERLAGAELPAVEIADVGSIGRGPAGLRADGPHAALLAWLVGRSGPDGLTVTRDGERVGSETLPKPPPLA